MYLSWLVSLSALMRLCKPERNAARVAGWPSMNAVRNSVRNFVSPSVSVKLGRADGVAVVRAAEPRGMEPLSPMAWRTTSSTSLGVQLVLDRHLLAPAFHASWI